MIVLAAPSNSSALPLIVSTIKRRADVLVDPVGRQQKDVAFLDRERPVIDLDLGVNPEGAAQIALLG